MEGSAERRGFELDRLDLAIRSAARAQDPRMIICLVERWPDDAEVPRHALMLEARALLSVRMMDFAWECLSEVLQRNPDDIEGLALATHMFLQRGWKAPAQKLLEHLLSLKSDSRGLEALVHAVAHPPRILPSNMAEIEVSGTLSARLDLAERLLATGRFAHGRAMVERLRHQAPTHERIALLWWALQGDYSGGTNVLDELVDQVLGVDPSQEWTDRIHADADTDATTGDALAEVDPEFLFPSLFLSAAGREGQGAVEDDTRVTRDHEAETVSLREITASDAVETSERGDTEWLGVIGDHASTAEGPTRELRMAGPQPDLATSELRVGDEDSGHVEYRQRQSVTPPSVGTSIADALERELKADRALPARSAFKMPPRPALVAPAPGTQLGATSDRPPAPASGPRPAQTPARLPLEVTDTPVDPGFGAAGRPSMMVPGMALGLGLLIVLLLVAWAVG